MRTERVARNLCVLTDWYTERPSGLTFRELGERYGMSESSVHQAVFGERGSMAKMMWPTESSRLVRLKGQHAELWRAGGVELVHGVVLERLEWSEQMMRFADDRRELAQCAEATT